MKNKIKETIISAITPRQFQEERIQDRQMKYLYYLLEITLRANYHFTYKKIINYFYSIHTASNGLVRARKMKIWKKVKENKDFTLNYLNFFFSNRLQSILHYSSLLEKFLKFYFQLKIFTLILFMKTDSNDHSWHSYLQIEKLKYSLKVNNQEFHNLNVDKI